MKKKPSKNHFFILKSERNSVLACYNPVENRLEKVDKRPVYGVRPRNAEQTFAIHAILNPEIKLITIQGWPVRARRCWPWPVPSNSKSTSSRFTWPGPSCR
jgi:predicted ribonuclease YlaK